MRKMPKFPYRTPDEIKALRKKIGMVQTEFWAPLGVTQSGGSRYEAGRNIPRSVQLLLAVTYGTSVQSQVAINYLRSWKE